MADERAELLLEIVGDRLASVTFGGDLWLSLSFDGGALLALYRWPSVRCDTRSLSLGDTGYSDAIIGLVGSEVTSAEQTSEHMLAVAFDGGAGLSVRLGGSLDDVSSYDVAVFHGVRSKLIGVWTVGERPQDL